MASANSLVAFDPLHEPGQAEKLSILTVIGVRVAEGMAVKVAIGSVAGMLVSMGVITCSAGVEVITTICV